MRDKVRFETNIPQTVALEYAEGKLSEGQFGDQYYYSLAGGRCMYVPPVVARDIAALGIQPGEEFEICKRQTRDGRRNIIRWEVGYQGQNAQGPHGELEVPAESSPKPAPRAERSNNAPAAPAVVQLPQTTSRLERMTSTLNDCVQAVLVATSELKLDNANLQALISTLYIQEGRQEEQRIRQGVSLPPAQPARVNGGQTWRQ